MLISEHGYEGEPPSEYDAKLLDAEVKLGRGDWETVSILIEKMEYEDRRRLANLIAETIKVPLEINDDQKAIFRQARYAHAAANDLKQWLAELMVKE
jgi:hypothetical protein